MTKARRATDLERLARRAGVGDVAAARRLLAALESKPGAKATSRPEAMPWIVFVRELGPDPDAESWVVGTFRTRAAAHAWAKRAQGPRVWARAMRLEPPLAGSGR